MGVDTLPSVSFVFVFLIRHLGSGLSTPGVGERGQIKIESFSVLLVWLITRFVSRRCSSDCDSFQSPRPYSAPPPSCPTRPYSALPPSCPTRPYSVLPPSCPAPPYPTRPYSYPTAGSALPLRRARSEPNFLLTLSVQ